MDEGEARVGWRWSLAFGLLLLAALSVAVAADGDPARPLYEGRGHMNRVLYDGFVRVTGWKILGWIGALCFAGRWLIQAWYRKRSGSAEIPTAFWAISLAGALLTTMYFIWGKNDSVGIIQNALPAGVAAYNLALDLRRKWSPKPATG